MREVAERPLIAIVLPDLRSGGAERMRVNMACEWLERGYRVEFVLMQKRGELLQMVPLDASVVSLEVKRYRGLLMPMCRYLHRVKPAVVLAAMWPLTVVTIAAARLCGGGGRVVISDHSILSRSFGSYGFLHRVMLKASVAIAYRLADERIAVSKGVAADVAQLGVIQRSSIRVIYNPAAVGAVEASIGSSPPLSELLAYDGRLVLAVGSLKPVKNFSLLVEAFSLLPEGFDAKLCILGDGPCRSELELLISSKKLESKILLPGHKLDLSGWYARADLFVLSSNHEGFGNVIVEALEQGVPVVSTDCPTGPREILCDGKYGRLVQVGDADALCQAILDEMNRDHDSSTLVSRAKDFSVGRVSDEYLNVMLPDRRCM